MINLLKDISILTDVNENTLNKFVPIYEYCIGHAVHEATCIKSDIVELDLGFGELHIKLEHDCIRYRFVPSKDLEKSIINTIKTHNSPIITKLESNLQEKIDRAYKELL